MTNTRPTRLQRSRALLAAVLAFASCPALRADLVEFVNGDQYNGTVVSMNETNLVMRGDIQGTVILPRGKVARITFRQTAGAADQPWVLPQPNFAAPATSGGAVKSAAPSRPQGVNTNLINQVKQQFLAQAPPEAGQKFDELLGGYLAGALSVNDIRSQARDAIKQIQQLKKETPELGDALDSYLGILQSFVREAADTSPGQTNSATGR